MLPNALCALLVVTLSSAVKAVIQKRHSDCFSYNVQGCAYPVIGKNGAAASEIGTCSEIAIDILEQGGNAADGEEALVTRDSAKAYISQVLLQWVSASGSFPATTRGSAG